MMNGLFLLSLLFSMITQNPVSFDFGNEKAGQDWRIINDGVMGGRSQSSVDYQEDGIVFSGKISLENRGGFSSFRSPFGKYPLGYAQSVEIRYRSTGQGCYLILEDEEPFYLPHYRYFLPVTNGEWKTVTISLESFQQYRLSDKTGKRLSSDTKDKIIRIGFIVANKKEGAFELECDYLSFQ